MAGAKPAVQALLCATLFLAAATATSAEVDLPFCTEKKIYILDLNAFAGGNIPSCDLNKTVGVSPRNGVIYLRPRNSSEPHQTGLVSHQYGMHSGPWYAMEAIRNSQYFTDNIDEADIVFVNDYCYYMWYLAWVHTKGRDIPETPGDHLVAAYAELVKTPRWKQTQGRDYVFYDPHPGYAAGNAENIYIWQYLCDAFKHSMHIVVERGQRNMCHTYWEMERKLLIVPYMPNAANLEQQYIDWETPLKPLAERELLVYTRTRCTGWTVDDAGMIKGMGKKMRYDFANAMANISSDVSMECTDGEYGKKHVDFNDMLHGMQNAKFCLAMPGDSQSSRRMSEMFMAGCIPVFAGPPYATMPLPQDVDYRQIAVLYNITQYHSWMSQTFNWEISQSRRAYPQDSWFWIPEAEGSNVLNIETINDLVPALRDIPADKLASMLEWMESQRQMFVFYPRLTERKTAVNAIVSRICDLAGAASQANPRIAQLRKSRRMARLSRSLITDGEGAGGQAISSAAPGSLQPMWVS